MTTLIKAVIYVFLIGLGAIIGFAFMTFCAMQFDVGWGSYGYGKFPINSWQTLLQIGAVYMTISFFCISGALAGIFCAEKLIGRYVE